MVTKESSAKTNIGYRLKELREKRGLSQAELAKRIGCVQTTVAEWERRKDRMPSKIIENK